MAFYLDDKGMPHTGCWIADNTSHRAKPDEALRSEITAGVSFYQEVQSGLQRYRQYCSGMTQAP
jgi:hypothetical protein